MTDISTIVATARDIDIKHPVTDQPLGLTITLLPDTHPKVRAAARKALNDRMSGKGKITAEQIEENQLALLCASVFGWDWQGDLSFHGDKPEFTDANLRKVLKELSWVKEQIDAELVNRTEFFRSDEESAG